MKIKLFGLLITAMMIMSVSCVKRDRNSDDREDSSSEESASKSDADGKTGKKDKRHTNTRERGAYDDIELSDIGKTKNSHSSEPQAPQRLNILNDGTNFMSGTFNYAGAKYGFSVTFRYDAATGKASDATYEADGYGSTYPLSTINVSSDRSNVYITLRGNAAGANTQINVSAEIGNPRFTGNMIRGTHSGTCTLMLQ